MPLVSDLIAILLFAGAAGAFLATALPVALAGLTSPTRWAAVFLMIGASAHALDWIAWHVVGDRGAVAPLWMLSLVTSGFFWAFVQASFEDKPIQMWRRALPSALMLAAGLAGALSPLATSGVPWLVYNTIVVLFMGHALWMLARGWSGDLVEGRRRLRGPIMVATVVYILLVQLGDILGIFGQEFSVEPRLQGLALLGLALGAASILFRPDNALFEPLARESPKPIAPALPAQAPPQSTVDPLDRALAARLERAMDTDRVWRQEQLTIATLAALLNTPEHRLRHLINTQLGHRNFAGFVNARRIAAAKQALSDPENGRKPVSAIAFELGFGSLGPFNRAFKEATGLTPTQWRQQALEHAPNLENPD
jgi:AraC-like DNA-binding protein